MLFSQLGDITGLNEQKNWYRLLLRYIDLFHLTNRSYHAALDKINHHFILVSTTDTGNEDIIDTSDGHVIHSYVYDSKDEVDTADESIK